MGVRENEARPFSVIQDALSAANVGDTIYVRPGTYNGPFIIRNGINFYFELGAIIQGPGGVVFTDVGGADPSNNFTVSGQGHFTNYETLLHLTKQFGVKFEALSIYNPAHPNNTRHVFNFITATQHCSFVGNVDDIFMGNGSLFHITITSLDLTFSCQKYVKVSSFPVPSIFIENPSGAPPSGNHTITLNFGLCDILDEFVLATMLGSFYLKADTFLSTLSNQTAARIIQINAPSTSTEGIFNFEFGYIRFLHPNTLLYTAGSSTTFSFDQLLATAVTGTNNLFDALSVSTLVINGRNINCSPSAAPGVKVINCSENSQVVCNVDYINLRNTFVNTTGSSELKLNANRLYRANGTDTDPVMTGSGSSSTKGYIGDITVVGGCFINNTSTVGISLNFVSFETTTIVGTTLFSFGSGSGGLVGNNFLVGNSMRVTVQYTNVFYTNSSNLTVDLQKYYQGGSGLITNTSYQTTESLVYFSCKEMWISGFVTTVFNVPPLVGTLNFWGDNITIDATSTDSPQNTMIRLGNGNAHLNFSVVNVSTTIRAMISTSSGNVTYSCVKTQCLTPSAFALFNITPNTAVADYTFSGFYKMIGTSNAVGNGNCFMLNTYTFPTTLYKFFNAQFITAPSPNQQNPIDRENASPIPQVFFTPNIGNFAINALRVTVTGNYSVMPDLR